MDIKTILLSLLMMTLSCSSPSLKKPISDYRQQANELIHAIDKKGFNDIKSSGKQLVSEGQKLLKQLKKKWPHCKPVFTKVIDEAENMSLLSLEEIEKQYHQGESLPKTQDDCLNAKELVVHPATVLVLINKKDTKKTRNRMLDEIEEVLSHLDILL